MKLYICSIVFLTFSSTVFTQSLFDTVGKSNYSDSYRIRGFAQSGFFVNHLADNPELSSGFSDLALQFTAEDGSSYKAYADIRFRYGLEFGNPASNLSIKEAYISWYNKWMEISAGQKVIKWSRSDFFPVQNRMNARNELYRTFDDSDRDLGNIVLGLNIYPLPKLSLELLYLPFERSSTLSSEIMDLPDIVNIVKSQDLSPGINNGSWAFNMGLNFKNIDIGFNCYLGINPMPMIYYDTLILYLEDGDQPTELLLNSELYTISMFSTNIEFVLGKTIFRGDLTYLNTDRTGSLADYIPFSELIWTAGIEPSLGNLSLLIEYQGKSIPGFTEAESEPAFTKEIVIPPGIPPMIVQDAIAQQVSSFNRLYNYQLNKMNHSLALRFSYNNTISIVNPELNIIYNITTDDLLINPKIIISTTDNFLLIVGSDIYRGRDNSLYEMLKPALTSVYAGLKVNF